MVSSSDFHKALGLINKSTSILITTHAKPDGDACGSMAAMAQTLVALGKDVKLLLLSPMPRWYDFLFDRNVPVLGRDVPPSQLTDGGFGQFDLIIIMDTNSYSQLPEFAQYLRKNEKTVLVIDHHETSDGLGNVELLEPHAAATALIVFDFLKFAGWPITESIAEALFVAIATDTGWFRFSNTDVDVFGACAELFNAGANPPRLHHLLYQNFSPARFRLLTAMLNTLELHFDGRYAAQHLLQRDFEQTGAVYADTENLIDECRRISTVQTAALFVELKDGRIKCSLRSTGPIDVCKIAQKLGGGGHTQAAGLHLDGPMQKVKDIILGEMKDLFNSPKPSP